MRLRPLLASFVLTTGIALLSSPAVAGCLAPAGFTKAWNGVTSTWSTATNWAPSGVPATADNVYICSGATVQPVLTAAAATGDLFVDTGASIDVGAFTLTVTGNADLTLITGSGKVVMSGSSKTLRGNLSNLHVPSSGVITLNGSTNVTGNVFLAAGDLTLGGNTLRVDGDFQSDNLGDRLYMTNAADVLDVRGNVSFTGGGATGIMTAGELHIGGDFTESNECCTGTAFRPSGSHKTVFDGSRVQTVTFNGGGNNGFNHVEIQGAGTTVVTAARPNVLVIGNIYDISGGRWQVENTTFRAPTLELPPRLVTNATFPANTSLATNFVLDGDMMVTGTLLMNGQTVRVTGDFATNTLGDNFTMTNPADRLIVDGNVTFGGGGGLNLMTAGQIRIKGNFTEANECCTGQAFRPSGDHTTIFEGTNSTINFIGGGSNSFHNLSIEGNVTLATNVTARGQLAASGSSNATVSGAGQQLNVAGLNVARLTFDNVILSSVGGELDRVEDLVFRNHAPAANQFSVTHPGGQVSFHRTQFLATPTTGRYIRATDPATSDSNPLHIRMIDSTPADGTPYESENGGAIIQWITNAAPIAANDSYSTSEDTRLDVSSATGVLANDSDPEAAALTASVVTPPSSGTLDLRANGSFSYTPVRDFNGTVTFEYGASDPQGLRSTAAVTIIVNAANDAPFAGDDFYTAPANSELNIAAPGVLTNDTDADNDAMSASIASQPAHGVVTLASSGAFTYVPNAGFSGDDSFTYVANDAERASAPATVRISVAEVPVRAELRANPTTIRKGGTATLLWQVANATSVTIEPGVGPVDPRGSAAVSPAATTTYILTAQTPSTILSREVTIQVAELPAVTLVSRPRPLMQPANVGGDTSRFALANIGGTSADVTLQRNGEFFAESAGAFTLAPGQTKVVTLTGAASTAGHHEGSLRVLVNGALALTVPVDLLSAPAVTATTRVTATAHRSQISGMNTGTVTFTNNGNTEVHGIIASDVPWMLPRIEAAVLAPGASLTVPFDVDRTLRSLEANASGSLTFNYLSESAVSKVTPNTTTTFPKTTSVTVRDVVTPVVSGTGIPPLDPSHLALYLPGLLRTERFVSDLAVKNRSAVSLSSLALYFTPGASSPFSSFVMQLPTLNANASAVLADAIKSGFGSSASSGTAQIRGEVTITADLTNITNSSGTTGTAMLPLRSDRAAAKGESLQLTGVEKTASTHTDLYLQETSGAAATTLIAFLDANGSAISTRTESLAPFGSIELRDAVPERTVAIRITTSATSNGRVVARALVSDATSGDISEIIDWSRNFAIGENDEQLIPWAATNGNTGTDLHITNRGATVARGTFLFTRIDGRRNRPVSPAFSSLATDPSAMAESAITVNPNQTIVLRDVLRTAFGASGTAAGYLTYVPSTGTVSITTTVTTNVDGKTLVLVPPALKRDLALARGATKRFSGIEDAPRAAAETRASGTFRNAIGLIETSNQPVTIRLRIYYTQVPRNSPVAVRASAERTYSLRPRSIMKIDDVAAALLGSARDAMGTLHDSEIDVDVLDGDGAVIPFLLTTDNGSRDTRLRLD